MQLETLIAPILSLLCEYCSFKQKGFEVSEDIILSEIRAELNSIVQRCANAPLLYQQYLSIEKPLIFFIDYTIKEGGFSFSGSYKELARTFNELSGDDKFFDLLNNALQLNEDQDNIRIFYLLMGLGFDGVYKRNRADMVEVMQNTASHLPSPMDFNHTAITPELNLEGGVQPREPTRFYHKGRFWVLFFIGVTVFSLICNWVALDNSVSGFVDAIDGAAKASQGVRANQLDSVVTPIPEQSYVKGNSSDRMQSTEAEVQSDLQNDKNR